MHSRKNNNDESFSHSFITPAHSSNFHIEFNNSREVIAEGCLGIISCGENQIKLNMGSQTLLLTGCDLVISNMFGKTVCVHGKILSAEFI